VEVLIAVARGTRDVCSLRSRSSVSIPARASVMAAVSPAGPAPTTTTRASSVWAFMRVLSSDALSDEKQGSIPSDILSSE
jgi:hypothetical protein